MLSFIKMQNKQNLQLVTIVIFVEILSIQYSNQNNVNTNNHACTEEFCRTYRDSIGCPEVARACRFQNSTSNGRLFLSPTECNCCEMCVANLELGDYCSKGLPGSPTPTAICGPGLYCQTDPRKPPTCQRMSSTSVCFKAQKKFDEDLLKGTIGNLQPRPLCDDDGYFMPTVCIEGQTCYCVNKLGKRIFGDGLFRGNMDVQMKCECSRMNEKLKELVTQKFQHFSLRCSEDGGFDMLQCFGEVCLCVDKHTGAQTSHTRNITHGLSDLPCYDNNIHSNITYLRECELIKLGIIRSMKSFSANELQNMNYLYDICEPDGFYAPVRMKNNIKYCADKNGRLLESFQVTKDSKSAITMNCKCARARMLLKANGYLELPECCPNGNYKKMACRRGHCFCVDENGIQNSLEVPQRLSSKLSCAVDICDG